MSKPPSLAQIRPAASQLPVDWYFDPDVFAREKKLFAAGANYMGHELMVPNVGDYYTLGWMDDAKVLVRNPQGVELLSNVCRHRQAIMLQGRGNLESIVCPLHRWTYDLKGELLGAHKRGLELARYCQERLDAARAQVKVLEGDVLRKLTSLQSDADGDAA